jgi:hypothetical protein
MGILSKIKQKMSGRAAVVEPVLEPEVAAMASEVAAMALAGEDDLFPIFDAPRPISEAATGWRGHLVWLSLAPRIDGGVVDLNASAVVRPFRVLADGSIEVSPERIHKSFAFGSLLEERTKNNGNGTAFSRVIDQIVAIIKTALKNV